MNKLIKLGDLKISEDTEDLLDIITSFNIEARYPDYKKEFYKKCTPEFASYYKEKIIELRLWLLEHLHR